MGVLGLANRQYYPAMKVVRTAVVTLSVLLLCLDNARGVVVDIEDDIILNPESASSCPHSTHGYYGNAWLL